MDKKGRTIQETKTALAARIKARHEGDASARPTPVVVPKSPSPPSARLIAKALTSEMPLKPEVTFDD